MGRFAFSFGKGARRADKVSKGDTTDGEVSSPFYNLHSK